VTEKPKSARKRPRSPATTLEIRQMQLKDIPEVFEMGQRLFTAEELPTLYRSWDDHELTALFGSDEETCLVAESGGRMVGFALGRMMDKPRNAWRYGWLEWLGVEADYKRSGVATRLLTQLTNLFIERNARIMLVDTDAKNHGALTFFRKHGFGQEIRHVYLSLNLEDNPRYQEHKASQRTDRGE
jgi:ribosomal protein S18 acetylase RimI-like enzyme